MQKLMILFKTLFMAACAIVIFGFITEQFRRIDPFMPITLPPWMTLFGIVLMAAGTFLTFICFGLFSANRSLSLHSNFPDPEVFISWGPYKYVRNPMAKGGWTVLCGWGFYHLSPSILLFAISMAIAMHLFVIYFEEPKLERRFGESYREYKRKVSRWLPNRQSLSA